MSGVFGGINENLLTIMSRFATLKQASKQASKQALANCALFSLSEIEYVNDG